MKGLKWYERGDLRYVDIPEPDVGSEDVKIKIRLAGICGSDLKEYKSGPIMIPTSKTPITLGHEFSGTVVEVGSEVNDLRVGDRVSGPGYRTCGECYFCKKGLYNLCANLGFPGMNEDGCMAEYMVAPERSLNKLPDSVSDEEGALIEPLAVAMHAVRIGMITREDSVAIIGDGTIGLCALSVAKALGISPVFLISKHKNRGEVARALGATAVISLSDGDSAELISNFIDGPGVDKSIECAGTLDSAQLSMKITRRGGTIVLVGVFDEQSSLPLSSCCFDEKTLVGSCLYVGEFKEIISLLQNKKIDISPLITSIIPIEDALEMGFNKLLTSKEDIKVLVRVS